MARKNYGKEQELFAAYILKYVLNNLVLEKMNFHTYSWEYDLVHVDSYWAPEWWEQLTDKIISLKYRKNNNSIIESNLFIESKAYLKWISDESVNGSFEMFENKLPQFWNEWYASSYVVFRCFEKESKHYFIKKRIEDDTKLPDHFFEIDESFFIDKYNVNPLDKLFASIKSWWNHVDLIQKYIDDNKRVIKKLEEKIAIELEHSFNKYETSEKRLLTLLENRNEINKNKGRIINKSDYKNWFTFEWKENKSDLIQAEEEQELYLLNKYHYLDNPLIKENIEKIEWVVWKYTFNELDWKKFDSLTWLTSDFIEEFKDLEIINKHQIMIKKYLFEWWKPQKRGFLFDSWANQKCLLYYNKSNNIKFLSELKDE